MTDPRLPAEMDAYMEAAGWGEHHDQWHYEQRYDYWRHRAAQGDAGAAEVVAYGDERGWGRAPHQEGAAGHGLHFLAMHRAMFQLLAEAFPQHGAYLAGWSSPPQDPRDPDDPVADGSAFPREKAEGVRMVESRAADFPDEDGFALFLETSIRPTPRDPTARTPDQRTGLHNWFHGRWTDATSPVNLGDPTVNLFNARFWRLHGWIDRVWSGYRRTHGLRDDEPGHVARIREYRHMMEHGGHGLLKRRGTPRPERLRRLFDED